MSNNEFLRKMEHQTIKRYTHRIMPVFKLAHQMWEVSGHKAWDSLRESLCEMADNNGVKLVRASDEPFYIAIRIPNVRGAVVLRAEER